VVFDMTAYPPTRRRRLGPVARERTVVKLLAALQSEGELTVWQLREALTAGNGKRVLMPDIRAALQVLEQRGHAELVAGSGSAATWRATP
jgi:hypothetical protein